MPDSRQYVPPQLWVLSEEGRSAAARLRFPADAYLVASDEPKAWQTLEPAGPVVRDERFGEVRRDDEPWEGGYRELRRAYVGGADHSGWEPRERVVARFDRAVAVHLVRAAGRTLVIGTHGMAMTAWLAARVGPLDPGEFWAGLRFPDVLAVDLARAGVTPWFARS